MKSAFLRNAIVLGMLSAIGPFAIDMYLPAFPVIARGSGVDIRAVQMSLMSFFLAVALCQVLYGPISDRLEKAADLCGAYAVRHWRGSGAASRPAPRCLSPFASSRAWAPGASMVITRAIIRDLHTGQRPRI